MKRIWTALALAALLISPLLFSPVRKALAADLPPSNFGLNDTWPIWWGTGKAYIYGNSVSNYIRLGTNSSDQLFLTTTGLGIGAAPTNALSVTGNANVTGNTTIAGTLGAPLLVYTTNQVLTTAIPTNTLYWVQEQDLATLSTNAYNLAMSTANVLDSCVYIAISTNGAGGAVAGNTCHK